MSHTCRSYGGGGEVGRGGGEKVSSRSKAYTEADDESGWSFKLNSHFLSPLLSLLNYHDSFNCSLLIFDEPSRLFNKQQ